ncbi:hypothetical protein [uncultured Enterovirga sp.]|uniref:hypothetical protein n=1 Tax=uncultured Enterovirga sp. TaxID=2026352 RepID=UPI0035C98F14
MRILLYNFEQPDGAKTIGGGVTVYSRNLLDGLSRAGHELIFLSSGEQYDFFNRTPRLRSFKRGTQRAVIVNSPVFAPAHSSFHDLETYLSSPTLDPVPSQIRERYGDIDVFHFQNIEGLTAGFFAALRETFPRAQLLLSAHNYHVVCPQVNLWFSETRHCVDYEDGRACSQCVQGAGRPRLELNIRRMEKILACIGVQKRPILASLIRQGLRAPLRAARRTRALLARLHSTTEPAPAEMILAVRPVDALPFARYRARNIHLCTTVFDRIVAVSRRTRDVLIERGVPANKISVSYIGTAHKDRFTDLSRRMATEDGLHLAYLGYMRRDKGFYFFLACLQHMPRELASAMAITIAARVTDDKALAQMRAIAPSFKSFTLYDGYTHHTLDSVLEGVNLGIVPVLWEDNLPQVAIEMVCRGIPLLTSDRGGAQEIGSNKSFVFAAGSQTSFYDRLASIAGGRTPLERFWIQNPKIVSNEEHVDEIMSLYALGTPFGGKRLN